MTATSQCTTYTGYCETIDAAAFGIVDAVLVGLVLVSLYLMFWLAQRLAAPRSAGVFPASVCGPAVRSSSRRKALLSSSYGAMRNTT